MPLPKEIPIEIKEIIKKYDRELPYFSCIKLANYIISKEGKRVKFGANTLYHYVGSVRSEMQNEINIKEPITGFEMVESDYEEYEAVEIPLLSNKILVLSDLHIPHHDKRAIEVAVNYGLYKNANTIILNGDILDFHGLSRFVKIPKHRDVGREINFAKEFFKRLRDMFPAADIYFKEGNHDERWFKFICEHAELANVQEMQLETILRLGEQRIKFIGNKRIIHVGKLNIIHGHEIFAGSGVINIARTVRLKANESVLFGHFHRTNEDYQKTIRDKQIGAWATGCLCGLKPQYMPVNNWGLGFAFIETDNDGTFVVENKKIINYEIK